MALKNDLGTPLIFFSASAPGVVFNTTLLLFYVDSLRSHRHSSVKPYMHFIVTVRSSNRIVTGPTSNILEAIGAVFMYEIPIKFFRTL